MGWTIEVARTTAASGTTAWPASGFIHTWGASSAVGFFGNSAGGPVTVGTWQSKSALITSTTTPTITRMINNLRFITSTGFAYSSGQAGSETYINKASTNYTTPRPSAGVKFGFSTSGSVTVTQASAWYGTVDNAGIVSGSSANTGFGVRIAELTTTEGWTAVNESNRKKRLNVNAKYRQALAAGTTAQWFLAFSLSPKSAGAKKGGVAIDITYS